MLSASASRNISLAMNWSPRLLAFLVGRLQQRHQVAARLHRLPALHLRQRVDRGFHRRAQRAGVGAGPIEQRFRAVGLGQHGRQQVRRFDVRVVARHGQALGIGQGLLERGGELVQTHGQSLCLADGLRGGTARFKPETRRLRLDSANCVPD